MVESLAKVLVLNATEGEGSRRSAEPKDQPAHDFRHPRRTAPQDRPQEATIASISRFESSLEIVPF